MKRILALLIVALGVNVAMAQAPGSDCFNPLPFCTGQTYSYPAGVNNGTAQPGPNYGCLFTQPNPVWYYFQVDNPGNIDIYMVGSNTNNINNPTNDIDFICYGPFTSLAGVCPSQLTAANTVDCSYSASATETVNIVNAPAGAIYLLLITNYSNNPANIIFSQTGGNASTDCGVLSAPDNNGPLCVGQTLQLTVDTPYSAGPYAFYWTGPNGFTSTLQNPTIPNAQLSHAGTYTVVLTHLSSFESDTSTTTVVINPIPAAPSFTPTPVCAGQQFCNSPNPPLIQGATYTWSATNGVNSTAVPYCNIGNVATWNGVTLSLTVTVNGCTSPPFSAPITVNPVPSLSITGNNSACEGTYVNLTATPGNLSNYTWTNSSSTTNTATVLAGGTYTVSATQNGCTGTSAPFTVNIIPNPLDITGNVPFCDNDSIVITATAGKDQYVWNGVPGNETYTLTGSSPNPTVLTVESANGCVRTDSIHFVLQPTPDIAFSPDAFCDGNIVPFINQTTIDSPSTIAGYAWLFGDGTNSTLVNPEHEFPSSGNYTVSLIAFSNQACIDTLTKDFRVHPNPVANFNAEPLCFGLYLFSDSTKLGDTTLMSYQWTFDVNNDTVNLDFFEYQFGENVNQVEVTYTVVDEFGCSSDTTRIITIEEPPQFSKLPNIITPNGDGINDKFEIPASFDKCFDYSIRFFNRWGQKVYDITQSTMAFDGTNSLGAELEDGVYYYVIVANGKKVLNGTVTVVRGGS